MTRFFIMHSWGMLRRTVQVALVAMLIVSVLLRGMVGFDDCGEPGCARVVVAGQAVLPDAATAVVQSADAVELSNHHDGPNHDAGAPCLGCPCACHYADLPAAIRVLAVLNAITYLPRPVALMAPPAPILDFDPPPIIRG